MGEIKAQVISLQFQGMERDSLLSKRPCHVKEPIPIHMTSFPNGDSTRIVKPLILLWFTYMTMWEGWRWGDKRKRLQEFKGGQCHCLPPTLYLFPSTLTEPMTFPLWWGEWGVTVWLQTININSAGLVSGDKQWVSLCLRVQFCLLKSTAWSVGDQRFPHPCKMPLGLLKRSRQHQHSLHPLPWNLHQKPQYVIYTNFKPLKLVALWTDWKQKTL